MPFIADVSFERPDKQQDDKFRFVRIGSIWYDPGGQGKKGPSASVLLQAVRVGTFVARPRNQDDAPYLEGDMCVKTGTFEENGITKGKYMNVGFIQTKEGNGITYFGQILCDPSPLLTLSRVKEMMAAMIAAKSAGQHFDLDAFSMNGIFVPIFLADRNRGSQDDNLPF
jgi:hypothetical protein